MLLTLVTGIVGPILVYKNRPVPSLTTVHWMWSRISMDLFYHHAEFLWG